MSAASNLSSFASDSSIHGIRYIFDRESRRSVRLFWTTAFAFSILGFGFYVHGVYEKWSSNPDIAMKNQWRAIREVPFPAITICLPLFAKNVEQTYSRFAMMRQKSDARVNLSVDHQRALAANMQACNPHLTFNIIEFCPNASDFNVVDTLAATSPEVNEAFGVCFIRRRQTDCRKLIARVLTDNGLCYTYNIQNYSVLFNEAAVSRDFDSYRQQEVIHSLASGNDTSGEQWTIYDGYKTEDEDVFPMRALRDNVVTFYPMVNLTDVPAICLRSGKGFRVYFHAPNEIMTHLHNEYFIPFGFEKQLVLTARHTHYNRDLRVYAAEKRQCYFEGERVLTFFKSYSKAHCLIECLADFVLRECGCVKFSMPRAPDTPVCNLSRVACYTDANSRWPRDDTETKALTAMPCDCFPSCDDITYFFKLDRTGEFESKVTTLSRNAVYSEISVRFTDLIIDQHVYYVGYKVQNFIADTGGLLGLFMGCSILSLVEVLYFCISWLIDRYWKVHKRVKKIKFMKRNVVISTIKCAPIGDEKFLETLQYIDRDLYVLKGPLYSRNTN